MTAATTRENLEERLRQGSTTRMFQSDFFEFFSRVHPVTPFVTWLPAVAFVLWRSASRADLPIPTLAGILAAGAFAWTFAEYTLHRFLFHWENGAAWGKRVHFMLHGVHHDFPEDKDRLVMPPGFSVPMGIAFYLLFRALCGPTWGEPLFAGFALGYLWYDGTHFAVHHFKLTSGPGRRLRRHHLFHHHSDPDGGFGVSSPLWDLVFRTMPRSSVQVRREAEASAAR
ncbi:MAG TPA: sterol desaturase family protein [Myxococcales bacterium]|jgi:sterol desaturase/sphingolipid hydroxylase (fatty acid hydroxylase superfamily)